MAMLTSATDAQPLSARGSRLAPRNVVGSLWLFAVLCYLYCDVISLHYARDLTKILTGSVNGVQITQGFLLASALLMSIPISMVLIVRVASHRLARWGTVVGATVMTVAQIGSLTLGDVSLHYAYFSAIEIATTVFLVQYALRRWPTDG